MRKILIFAVAALSLFAAYRAGFNHAMNDSEYLLTSYEEDENGKAELHIFIDGEHYINGLWIG